MSIKTLMLGLVLTGLCSPAFSQVHDIHVTDHGHGDADPLLAKLILDRLEVGEKGDNLEAQVWVGKDLHKLSLKAEVEYADATEKIELQALYTRAISPYWDVQLGVRHDQRPAPNRNWVVVGVQGLAPYFFEVEAAAFVGEQGRSAARIKVEYDLLFTQRLILSPEFELNAYGQNDAEIGTGSGLSNSRAGLRLRYEIRRELAPYLGVEWHKNYGNTADLNRVQGKPVSEQQWVLGLRAWY